MKKEPNKAVELTPASVTPPAVAGAAPLASVAHLDVRQKNMFTFGRSHEKACARGYVRNPADMAAVEHIVDLVHDHIEGTANAEQVGAALKEAIAGGGSGVWEQAGAWLVKLSKNDKSLDCYWDVLAEDESALVRFRVASFLSDMNGQVSARLRSKLILDRSNKVRQRAEE